MVAPGIGREAPMSARARPRHPLTRSWGSHTQARDAVFAGTRHTPPPKTSTFPRDKDEKSPFHQRDLSILIVGPNQLRHRRFRTDKPKSCHNTNTFCPLTPVRVGWHCRRRRAGVAACRRPWPPGRWAPSMRKTGDPKAAGYLCVMGDLNPQPAD